MYASFMPSIPAVDSPISYPTHLIVHDVIMLQEKVKTVKVSELCYGYEIQIEAQEYLTVWTAKCLLCCFVMSGLIYEHACMARDSANSVFSGLLELFR